jgi:hypothetical protein
MTLLRGERVGIDAVRAALQMRNGIVNEIHVQREH